jgi:hypothetical protein
MTLKEVGKEGFVFSEHPDKLLQQGWAGGVGGAKGVTGEWVHRFLVFEIKGSGWCWILNTDSPDPCVWMVVCPAQELRLLLDELEELKDEIAVKSKLNFRMVVWLRPREE